MPRTKEGWTSVSPSIDRMAWMEAVAERMPLNLNLDDHGDRLYVIDHCLRREAERDASGTEPLAGAITTMIRGIALGVARKFRRGRGHPEWQKLQEEGWALYCEALQSKR